MELLELEMRARAIKSLLNVEKGPEVDKPAEPDQPDVVQPPKPEAEKSSGRGPTDAGVSLKLKPQPEKKKEAETDEAKRKKAEEKEAMRLAAEEEKKLQKAREVLMASEAKKREEEEALERKHAEIRFEFFVPDGFDRHFQAAVHFLLTGALD